MAKFESPSEIISSKKTIPLDMSHRQISKLDYPVLPHLVTHLYLNDNHLTSLPKDFFKKFVNVQWLDLRNNLLTDLPNLRYSFFSFLALNCGKFVSSKFLLKEWKLSYHLMGIGFCNEEKLSTNDRYFHILLQKLTTWISC